MAQGFPPGVQSTLAQVIPIRREPAQTRYGLPDLLETEIIKSGFAMRISALEMEVRRLKKESIGYMKINLLPNKTLRTPLDVIVETDGDEFIARTIDLCLYGRSEDPIEAIEMLKREIESVYDDLKTNDNFTEDWLKIKAFLTERICD